MAPAAVIRLSLSGPITNMEGFMRIRGALICLLCLLASAALLYSGGPQSAGEERHLLYVAVPGIRNYVEYGGVGILVYDVDGGHKFVKRIPTWETPSGG